MGVLRLISEQIVSKNDAEYAIMSAVNRYSPSLY